jgi:hypothetical protein
MVKATNRTGSKLFATAEVLCEILSGGEMESEEVWQKVQSSGISGITFARARKALGVKARRCVGSGRWVMYLPQDGEQRLAQLSGQHVSLNSNNIAISHDWAKVIIAPATQKSAALTIRCGMLEIEADADFPLEKLTALLREIGGALC